MAKQTLRGAIVEHLNTIHQSDPIKTVTAKSITAGISIRNVSVSMVTNALWKLSTQNIVHKYGPRQALTYKLTASGYDKYQRIKRAGPQRKSAIPVKTIRNTLAMASFEQEAEQKLQDVLATILLLNEENALKTKRIEELEAKLETVKQLFN